MPVPTGYPPNLKILCGSPSGGVRVKRDAFLWGGEKQRDSGNEFISLGLRVEKHRFPTLKIHGTPVCKFIFFGTINDAVFSGTYVFCRLHAIGIFVGYRGNKGYRLIAA